MRTLIVLSAIPGSGKSTWAKRYQKEHANTFIVASDEIRVQLLGRVNDFSKESLVWCTFLDNMNHYAETMDNVTVIADATNLQNKYKKYYAQMTPKFDRHILVRFDIPYDICLIQNTMREKDRIVPPEAMAKLLQEFELPDEETLKCYDDYQIITDFISRKALNEEKKKSGA